MVESRKYQKGGRHAKEFRFQVIIEIIMCIITFLSFVPILVMVVTSFKSNVEIYNDFFAFPKKLMLSNYNNAFKMLSENMLNTLIVVAIAVVFTLVLAAVGGYVFGAMEFPGKGILFFIFSIPNCNTNNSYD